LVAIAWDVDEMKTAVLLGIDAIGQARDALEHEPDPSANLFCQGICCAEHSW